MGVVLEPLVVPIMEVCGFAVALGIIFVLHHFLLAVGGGIVGILGRAPWVGRYLASPLNAVYHWMDTEFGKAEQFLDAKMAAALHELARLCEWVGKEFHDHASLLLAVANVMTHPLSLHAYRALWTEEWKALAGLRSSINNASGGAIGAAIHAALKPIVGELHGFESKTRTWERTHGHAIDVAIPKDIAGLRARTRTIEDSLSSLWSKVKGIDALFGTIAFASAVALALDRIGLRFLKCDSLKSLGNRVGCGGWRILDELLAGVIDVLVIADLCQLTKLLIQVAESSEVQAVLSGVIGGIDELLLCQGVARPDELDGYWTEPPPPQKFAALPAV